MDCDTIWDNARLMTLACDADSLLIIERGLIAAKAGRIVYAGPRGDAPELNASQTIDCEDRLVTPGLIDCHTHLVYAGSRAVEWENRLAGASYEDIARAGGGILSTMNATRAAGETELMAQSRPRLDALIAEGVTTVEIKSGYGLDLATERRMLQVARSLGTACDVNVRTTFLGAHALPPEYAGRADDYIDLVIEEMLPQLAAEGLVDAVDAFCEGIGFTPDQTERVFEAAGRLGLPKKLHAEQLSNLHGAALAARHNALSADHLEYLDADGIAAMAQSGTVATLLPGAFYFTREQKLPPVAELRKADVPIAIATDCNPGTSPLTSLLLAMNMAATLFRLTVAECLAGTTRNAARALGLPDVGTLAPGKWADLAVWNVGEPAELVYRMGSNPLHARYWRGR
ncbi:MAG: imidazolonepropionase [Sphingomonadales bacterium]|nr:imidazolonepropionase [Sphingomonadales bacterium]PIX67251.1 MAG: imidazolonepropionase [Sphingomonadales bacterium CG_4_10_14_3_um_filter_58_15]NCO48662.1 imidazolonepropionase [Sphingomonadales bacterium]NCO99593.1 imidazolonepropionase [Sphingomonadales bacterium]NCP27129.1 imidazolonepropionase [Sphingomonadales bacterium]